jgi:hypothetical protein
MNPRHFFRLHSPDDASGGGGPVDRGDEFTPPVAPVAPPAAPAAPVAPTPEDKALAAELGAGDPDDADDASADKDKKKDSRIPLSRHEAVLQKERDKRADLERQLAQFRKGDEIAEVNTEITSLESNIIKLEKDYASFLADGEVDKATAIMALIRKDERTMAEAKSDMKIQAAEIRAAERVRYTTVLERIETSFPSLNPDHEAYDAEAEAEVLDLKAAYQSRGMSPTDALQKAVKLIVEPRTARQVAAVDTTPRVSDKDVAAERKKDAAVRTAAAVKATPASLNTGLDSDKLGGGESSAAAVMAMSQREFAALSDEMLSKLRGDEL